MSLVIRGNGVGDAKTLRDRQAWITQHGKWKWVLLQQQIILMHSLRGDSDQQRAALAQLRIELVPSAPIPSGSMGTSVRGKS